MIDIAPETLAMFDASPFGYASTSGPFDAESSAAVTNGLAADATPAEAAPARHVYHLFTVRHPQRDALAKLLTDEGISTAVYYPRSVPDQPMFGGGAERRWPEAWRASREVLSLPCFAELSDDEVERVVAGVRRACARL